MISNISQGNEAMDIKEDIDPYNLGTLMTLTQYRSFWDRFPTEPTEELDTRMEEASEELVTETVKGRKYTVYTDKHKAVFWYFNRVKLWKAAPAARKAQVEVCTGQMWAKCLKEEPDWNIYEKQTNKVNRKQQQLQEEHKQHLIEFFDKYPQATRQNAVDSLMESFQNFNLKTTSVRNFILHECNLTIKRVTLHPLSRNSSHNLEKRYDWVKKYINTDMNYLQNCMFVDETGFNINMRQPYARSISGMPAIVETPTTRAISHTILGAISANDVIAIEIREPMKSKKLKVYSSKRRKQPQVKKTHKGIVTGHYMKFISKTLDEMDKFPEMSNYYIIMDNVPIHTSHDITRMIETRGYRALYLPPYSPELNPIENFWSILKGTVKRSMFEETEDLKTRISEASESISRKSLCNIAQHSINNFEKCLNKEPL
ncbi:hypothetical protein INT45_010102 [Circinella minor]|uniref:Tc1-like transposase DDE domain-containing protein n=1 Tax=Circinella minor TaxID=1195481 RepID=A0A8H7RSR1_9FUNG|nr:hypothetical protein INT45_010102 [Circinella minor]